MQVSAAQGRLLVIGSKGGASLGDADQKELEGLINEVLQKTHRRSGTPSPTATITTGSSSTGSAEATESGTNEPPRTVTHGPRAEAINQWLGVSLQDVAWF